MMSIEFEEYLQILSKQNHSDFANAYKNDPYALVLHNLRHIPDQKIDSLMHHDEFLSWLISYQLKSFYTSKRIDLSSSSMLYLYLSNDTRKGNYYNSLSQLNDLVFKIEILTGLIGLNMVPKKLLPRVLYDYPMAIYNSSIKCHQIFKKELNERQIDAILSCAKAYANDKALPIKLNNNIPMLFYNPNLSHDQIGELADIIESCCWSMKVSKKFEMINAKHISYEHISAKLFNPEVYKMLEDDSKQANKLIKLAQKMTYLEQELILNYFPFLYKNGLKVSSLTLSIEGLSNL